MALPVPNLDDRRFQDLVDDAKRLVQQRCPEWTDHNVSDPGVTLIELFAWMTDQVVYRLNRVPDRNYVKFLELIGVSLYPPTAARTAGHVLAVRGRSPTSSRIPAGTQVATVRTETDEAIVFATIEDLPIIPSELADAGLDDRRQDAARPHGPRSRRAPRSTASRRCRQRRRRAAHRAVRGRAVERRPPALQLPTSRASASTRRTRRSPGRRGPATTGSRASSTPTPRAASTATATSSSTSRAATWRRSIAKQRAGWLRARVVGAASRASPPTAPRPTITGLDGDHDRRHRRRGERRAGRDEEVWASPRACPASGSLLKRGARRARRRARGPRGRRATRAGRSGPRSRDFAGQRPGRQALHARPRRRARSSSGRRSGWPTARCAATAPCRPRARMLRLREYRTGGGARGNVAHGRAQRAASRRSRTSRGSRTGARPRGGVDGEDIENAKVRGPIRLRTRGRAVTTEDFEQLAREAAPEVARVRAVAAGDGADAGLRARADRPVRGVRATAGSGSTSSCPTADTLQKITDRLEESRDHRHARDRRAARLPRRSRSWPSCGRGSRVNPTRLQEDALRALYEYFHPITGGPDGTGWPFGRPVNVGEIYSVLQAPPRARSSSRTPGCSAPTR